MEVFYETLGTLKTYTKNISTAKKKVNFENYLLGPGLCEALLQIKNRQQNISILSNINIANWLFKLVKNYIIFTIQSSFVMHYTEKYISYEAHIVPYT